MSRAQLETLLANLEDIHTDTAQAILRLRDLLTHYDDFTGPAQARIQEEIQDRIGQAQVQVDSLPDFRDRTG